MKGKSVIKSQQSKPKTGMKVSFNDKGLKRPNKPFSSGPAPAKFGAGKQFKQKGPGPAPKASGFKGGKPSEKPPKKQLDEDDDDEFDDDEEGDFEDLNEDDFDEEDDEDEDDEDEDDDMGEGDDEDADDMDEDDKEEPISKKAKAQAGNAKVKAAPAAQAQNAKPNKQQQQPQGKPLHQAQKANQKAETPSQKQAQKAGEKSTGAATAKAAAPRESAAKKPAVPAAFVPGRGAGANVSESNKAEAQFWEAVAKMPPLTPDQAKRVDDLLSSEGKRILFVKNIPEEVSASQVKALSPDILTVRIPMSSARKSKKNKKRAKFAFVEFANEALAQKNIAVIGRASFGEGHTLHASVARSGESDEKSMRASEWKVGVFFVGGINPSAPGGGGDPTGSETALTARQAAAEKAIRALVPNSDQVLVPINTTSLQIRGFAFVLFNDAQKAITAFEEIKKKALGGQPPMLFGSKVFISLAREKHHEKQPKTKPTQPETAKTPASPNVAAKAPTKPQTPQQPEQAAASAPAANADESFAKRARLTSGGSVASTGSASAQKKLLGSPALTPAAPAVSKPASPAAAKAQAATPQGKQQQQQQQQTSAKKEQAPPAKKQELAKGKGAPAAAGKVDKQGAQQAAAAAKGKKEQPGLKKAGAKRPLDEEDEDDDDDDEFIDEDDEGDDDEEDDEGEDD